MGMFDYPAGGMYGAEQFGDQTPIAAAIGNWLRGIGQDLGQRFVPGGYDTNRSFAQNALDPNGVARAMGVALSVGPGALSPAQKIAQLNAVMARNDADAAAHGADNFFQNRTTGQAVPAFDAQGNPILPNQGSLYEPIMQILRKYGVVGQ